MICKRNKEMKINAKVIILLTFGWIQLPFAFSFSTGLEINIVLSKSTYLIGEPIELGIELKNIGTLSLELHYPIPAVEDISFIILNEKGEQVPSNGLITCPSTNKKPLLLEPGEKFFQILFLNEDFGRPFGKNLTSINFFEIGNYTIEVRIKNTDIDCVSNKLNFSVIAPVGEEAIVFNKIEEVFARLDMTNKDAIYSTNINLLNLINEYPKSVYIPIILRWLSPVNRFFLNDTKTADKLREELVEKYPYSVVSKNNIISKFKRLADTDTQMDYLLEMKKRSINTLMEKFYDQKIDDLKELAQP